MIKQGKTLNIPQKQPTGVVNTTKIMNLQIIPDKKGTV